MVTQVLSLSKYNKEKMNDLKRKTRFMYQSYYQ